MTLTMRELEALAAAQDSGVGQSIDVVTAIETFLLACDANGLAETTIRWYRSLLMSLSSSFNCDVKQVTTNDLRKYIVDLRNKSTRYENAPQRKAQDGKLSDSTLTAHSTALHAFWKWVSIEYDFPNPMRNIKRIRPPQPQPSAIDGSDFLKLFNATSNDEAGYRNRAMLALFADTGVRLAGLASLTKETINLEQRRAIVTEKGNLTRIVPYTYAVAELIRAYLLVRSSGSKYIFTSTVTGQKLTASGIEQALTRLKKAAGVEGRVNPHSYRHRFALEYLKNGGDDITLSKLMGHKDVNTTAKMYALFSSDELAELHEERSPLKSLLGGV